MDFGLEFQKSKSRFRISIFERLCAPIFRQNEQVSMFGPKFAKNLILRAEFQKSKSGFGMSIHEILMCTNF